MLDCDAVPGDRGGGAHYTDASEPVRRGWNDSNRSAGPNFLSRERDGRLNPFLLEAVVLDGPNKKAGE